MLINKRLILRMRRKKLRDNYENKQIFIAIGATKRIETSIINILKFIVKFL